MEVEVEASGKSFLVSSISYHKYWRASIDGVGTAIYPTNIGFMGVVIPPGHHMVTYAYRNTAVIAGGFITAFALLAIALAFVTPVRRRVGKVSAG